MTKLPDFTRIDFKDVLGDGDMPSADAWTTPEHMAGWFSPMTTVKIPKLDLREGGEYRIDMKGEERDHVHAGRYLKVDRPRELAFTWISEGTGQQETVVTVRFEPRDGGTVLTLTHEKLPGEESRENHRKGWLVICDRLDEVLVEAPGV